MFDIILILTPTLPYLSKSMHNKDMVSSKTSNHLIKSQLIVVLCLATGYVLRLDIDFLSLCQISFDMFHSSTLMGNENFQKYKAVLRKRLFKQRLFKQCFKRSRQINTSKRNLLKKWATLATKYDDNYFDIFFPSVRKFCKNCNAIPGFKEQSSVVLPKYFKKSIVPTKPMTPKEVAKSLNHLPKEKYMKYLNGSKTISMVPNRCGIGFPCRHCNKLLLSQRDWAEHMSKLHNGESNNNNISTNTRSAVLQQMYSSFLS